MAELRLEELGAETSAAANNLTLKPGQEAFLEPETYEHLEQTLDPANSWPRVIREGDEVVGYIMGNFDADAPEDFLRAAIWRIDVSGSAQGKGVSGEEEGRRGRQAGKNLHLFCNRTRVL